MNSQSTDRNADLGGLGSRSLLSVLGPGILYAAAAVGISHLVQATRAGAVYGFGLTFVILLSCFVKYPALRFGGEFAAASGRDLIAHYRQTGWWAIGTYGIAQIFTMSFAVAAVTLVNVGLIKTTLGIGASDLSVAAGLLLVTLVLLFTGRYRLLERLTKFIVALFTLLIACTTILVIAKINWAAADFTPPPLTGPTVAFVIALMGFMPSPMDACVLQSLWTLARAKDRGRLATPAESRLDFRIGFGTSVGLAVCFMLLGIGVMYQSGIAPLSDAAQFSDQVIQLFTQSIGDWVYPVIAVAAVAVMFSTLLTLMDGYPRIVEGLFNNIWPDRDGRVAGARIYDIATILLAAGVLSVLGIFLTSFTAFIDMTAVVVFLTSPLFAYLNHRAMTSDAVRAADRPGTLMRVWSVVGILTMLALGVVYIYFRLAA